MGCAKEGERKEKRKAVAVGEHKGGKGGKLERLFLGVEEEQTRREHTRPERKKGAHRKQGRKGKKNRRKRLWGGGGGACVQERKGGLRRATCLVRRLTCKHEFTTTNRSS